MTLAALGKLAGPLVSTVATGLTTAGGCYANLGGLSATRSAATLASGIYSYVVGMGIDANERKEEQATRNSTDAPPQYDDTQQPIAEAAKNVGAQQMARASKIIQKESLDLIKSVGAVVAGAGIMFVGLSFDGSYVPLEFQASLMGDGIGERQDWQIIAGFITLTISETLTGLALLKAYELVGSLGQAGTSYLLSQAVKSNEESEGVKKEDQIGQHMDSRAVNAISKDVGNVFKVAAALAAGGIGMYAGSMMGGRSLATSVVTRFGTDSVRSFLGFKGK